METRYIKYSKLASEDRFLYFMNVYQFVRVLKIEYPGFDDWYNSLFDSFYQLKKDREIILCEKDGEIIGISILKKTIKERKICTLRVAKKYQHNGIGKRLMEMSFEELEDEKPLVTMHKSKYAQFSSLIDRYGFELEQKRKHYYSIFSTELVFNGELPEKEFSLNKIELIDFYTLIQDFLKAGSYDFDQYIERFITNCALREKKRVNYFA